MFRITMQSSWREPSLFSGCNTPMIVTAGDSLNAPPGPTMNPGAITVPQFHLREVPFEYLQ
jgi:hypothetical protein